MRIVSGALTLAVLLGGLSAPALADDLLARIRAKMSDVLLRQPNYTCTETVERTRQSAGNRSTIEDTLRLEVALVDGKEMFAWPGSRQFEDQDLRELVSTGMFGNGNFAIFARILFLTDMAEFAEPREESLTGQRVLRYDFQVARSGSGYRLRVNDREAVVGFHGSVYADPSTLDVRRVEVIADDIPPELNVSRAETRVDYSKVKIGEEEFPLPADSDLMMASPQGLSRNWVRFVSCRRFTGESTLSFDDPAPDKAPAAQAAVAEVLIPAGIIVQLQMPATDLMQAAVGDSIQAVVQADIRHRRQLLVPKNAIARGRIVQLDRDRTGFVLRIEFEELAWPGGHARFKATFDDAALVSRNSIRRIEPGGAIMISRKVGPRLSGILMFWRTEE